jgi:hypothetical protein
MNLLIAHLVGDYLFQNRWMALNKHKNSWVCVFHSTIYTWSIMVICGWWDWRAFVIALTHYLIDKFRIGAKWRQFFSRDTELPWTILSDNTMHLLILWGLSLI